MDANLIRSINRLWLPVYPTLARQVAGCARSQPRTILEVGCFSGGTGLELMKLFPESTLTLALEVSDLVKSFFQDWPAAQDEASRIELVQTPLTPLKLPESSFDLVFCRGVFFFLDEKGALLAEMNRVLSPGGVCFAGGGFGSHTPHGVIEPIADESRRLNYALGKKVVTEQEFRNMLRSNGLAADIVQDGGMWAMIKK